MPVTMMVRYVGQGQSHSGRRCQCWNWSLAWSLSTPRRPFLGCADGSGGPPQASSAVFTGGLVPDAACEAVLGEAWRDVT